MGKVTSANGWTVCSEWTLTALNLSIQIDGMHCELDFDKLEFVNNILEIHNIWQEADTITEGFVPPGAGSVYITCAWPSLVGSYSECLPYRNWLSASGPLSS